ncbi:uncharacterized protein PAS_chr4_0864 [Komagataella phaffii GS115]|uniref:Major mitochondrial nuclease, has RNAse and DNA endo-and exonucleolytic activities n=1 Tax=Komagataella phaffii (strain GS115 / ATCC 20864) TaxID=644223 RepID=C4R959_KOMPG|nr:uncharacterized protein PAS_chr4_0864 [Komagataella phaffii GS115]CAY72134.1 Major mitochondrial nuclease, has RNAse and DNA endo-and exonucleolytic activities [Komagataella phaffii GS115]
MFWSKAKDTIVANPTTISPSSLSPPTTSVSLETPIVRPSDFFKYGFPGPIHDLQTRAEFVSVYNRQTRNPYYVVEHLTPDSLASHNADRKNSFFKEDEQIPSIFRARLKDYFRSGPLFLPKQDPNDGKWKVTYELIGSPPSVAVPTHFFKLVVAEDPKNRRNPGDVALAAFVLPNEPIPNSVKLTDFEVPLEALERATGLEFMRKLEPQKQKPLCKEVKCELIIRDFNNNIKQLPLPQK